MDELLTLNGFLQYLVTSGGAIAVISFLFERIRWFDTLASETKDVLFTVFAAVVAVSAHLVLTYVPAETLSLFAPYFTILAGIVMTKFFSAGFHKVTHK